LFAAGGRLVWTATPHDIDAKSVFVIVALHGAMGSVDYRVTQCAGW
jgi:hypothetical protein